MISDVFLEWRFKRGYAKGLAKGREENRAEIEALKRRIEALEAAYGATLPTRRHRPRRRYRRE
jgi:hypothetical protein